MAHEAARGLSAQPPVVPHGREPVADIVFIPDHHQDDPREDEGQRHDIGGVEHRLPADEGQDAGDDGLLYSGYG